MGINNELASLNRTGFGQIGDLPDRGTEIGCEGDAHGVDYSQSAINRLGSIDGNSDSAFDSLTPVQDFTSARSDSSSLNGAFGSLDAGSDPVDAKNSNQ